MRLVPLTVVLSMLVACTKESGHPPSSSSTSVQTEVAGSTSGSEKKEGIRQSGDEGVEAARPAAPSPDSGATPLANADAGGAAPMAAEQGESPCRDKEKVRITSLQPGPRGEVRLEPDPGYGKVIREQELDLDGREPRDLHILWPGSAGSDGALMQGLFMACGDGLYAAVWGPEYAVSLQVRERRVNGWREVIRGEKAGTLDEPSLRHTPMHFKGGEYQDAPPGK